MNEWTVEDLGLVCEIIVQFDFVLTSKVSVCGYFF